MCATACQLEQRSIDGLGHLAEEGYGGDRCAGTVRSEAELAAVPVCLDGALQQQLPGLQANQKREVIMVITPSPLPPHKRKGLGSKGLLEDEECYPIRGQVCGNLQLCVMRQATRSSS